LTDRINPTPTLSDEEIAEKNLILVVAGFSLLKMSSEEGARVVKGSREFFKSRSL